MNALSSSFLSKFSLVATLGVLALLAAFSRTAQKPFANPGAITLGPFNPSTSLTVYLVNRVANTKAHLTLRRGGAPFGDRVLLRAFDAEEKNTLWQYIQSGRMIDSLGPQRGSWGIPPLQATSLTAQKAGDIVWEGDVEMRTPGVHQIRVVAGMSNTSLEVSLPSPLSWGVSSGNSAFKSWPGLPKTLFSLVPPKAEELAILGGPVRVSDENGASLFNSNNPSSPVHKVDVQKTNTIWHWDFPADQNVAFRAAGFPLILCPDEESARAIGASVETLPDGTVVAHKFQRRIAELLPALLDPKNVGRAKDLIVPLATREKEWLRDPIRNNLLLSPYGMMPSVEWALRNQNVDPQSHWGGSMYGWAQLEKLPPPRNRWDRWKSISETVPNNNGKAETIDLWAGASTNAGAATENLARAEALNAPFNPYYGKRELLYRAAAASLRDLMTLSEDETWRGAGGDLDDYPGFMAFPIGQKTMETYALVAPQMPPEVREVWTEGVEHLMDRQFAGTLVSARNQSAHLLLAYENMAKGSGLPRYEEMARRYAERFVDGQSPAGFLGEQEGPEASYTGISHWHEALAYRESGDPALLESLRRSYRFFNHTVAPEPDGQMLGGFNFNHRVGEGFPNEQWGGARGIVDDILPEVGLWAQDPTPAAQQQAAASILKALKEMPAPRSPGNLTNPSYIYAATPNRTGVWPARENGNFIRDFDGQLVAFKRANYYGVIYVGHPSGNKGYIASHEEQFRLPLANDPDNTGGVVNNRFVSPFLGGGLSIFWTPAYGSSILATNWSPLSHQGLVALQTDGKIYWEDYYATKYQLDQDAGTLRVEGRIENQPISYVRTYRFETDSLHVQIKLQADADVTLKGLSENLPFAAGAVKSRGVELTLPGENDGLAETPSFSVRDKNGAGVQVQFKTAQKLRVQRNGMKGGNLQIERVEVPFPSVWKRGQEVTLAYSLNPIK